MAGFRALAQQVRDTGRAPSQRRRALRKCLERFAPYGHRATWQHLCSSAGIAPDDRNPEPERLVRALEELEEARAVWLAYEAEVAARRRAEKRAGVRQPTALDEWHRLTWGGRSLLRCDPSAPPTPRLADVLRRMIAAVDYNGEHGTAPGAGRPGPGPFPAVPDPRSEHETDDSSGTHEPRQSRPARSRQTHRGRGEALHGLWTGPGFAVTS